MEECEISRDLGVVGEERNRLIMFLAGITRLLGEPVSVLVKGSSSSGKSNLVKNSLRLFPVDSVIERASLSAKAPAHSEESLANRILFIQPLHLPMIRSGLDKSRFAIDRVFGVVLILFGAIRLGPSAASLMANARVAMLK